MRSDITIVVIVRGARAAKTPCGAAPAKANEKS